MTQRNPNEEHHQLQHQLYSELWNNVKKGAIAKENEVIHGSLLALGMN
jgi:hypothetical protein